MKWFVGVLALTLAAFAAHQARAADCPDHCSEERIAYFAGIECYGPETISHDACNRLVWLLMREMNRRKIPCEHPGAWIDNQSMLARVNCVAGGEPANLKLAPTAYGMGLVSDQGGPRVMTFAPITSPAMWSQWLAKARGAATPTDEDFNPYQHMLTTMGPVLMESIQSVGHVCDRIEAIAMNDAPAVKYYHVTCNGSLRYTVGVSPTRTLVWAGDLSGY
jgi:hypothetical protein